MGKKDVYAVSVLCDVTAAWSFEDGFLIRARWMSSKRMSRPAKSLRSAPMSMALWQGRFEMAASGCRCKALGEARWGTSSR